MLFSDAVKVFEEIEKTTKRKVITDLLSNLFSKAGDDLKSLVYLIQGKLAPDYEGIESGMSDKYILKAIVEVSGKSSDEVTSMFHRIGDLGSLAENILVSKPSKIVEPVSLSVREMHEKFEASCGVFLGQAEHYRNYLSYLENASSPDET